ncbi:unnamed protein product [Penicillium discolor]
MGGMATVYRAEDIALERTVAVKMFRETDDAVVPVERVHSEKALLAGLNHPGLVTLLDACLEPGRPKVTTPGIVLGTLTYMAPEQLRNGDLRPSVDIYALGLVLLEALTGKPGFAPTLSVESALARLHIAPEIPAELGSEWAALLRAMTAIDPEARPHALEVESELRRLIDLPVTEEVATDLTVPLPAPTAGALPRTRAEARARRRAASVHPAASPARRTRRRRESLLIAAVVVLGAVTTASAALVGHGEQALASSGAVFDGASRIVDNVEDSVPVEPAPADAVVDSEPAETVAVEPVAATPVAPTAPVTESVDEESLPENAAPQAQENRGKSPGRDGNNGKGNSGKGNSSH